MTDDMETDTDDSRAEDALRAAFERAAEATQPGPLDGPAIRRKARTRSAGMVAAAAAAVLLLFGGVVGAVQLSRDPAPTASGLANQTETSAVEAPAKGWRFEYYRDVRLQVPHSWRYDDEPGGDWCVFKAQLPDEPYVAREHTDQVFSAVGCVRDGHSLDGHFAGPPVSTWVDHVMLSGGDGGSSMERRVGDFWVLKEPVGHAMIKVVTTDRQIADRIVSSAETVEADEPSCDPTSDIQAGGFQRPSPPFDIAALEGVDAILVCQYSLGEPGATPGLLAQHELVGAAADDELEALQSAPLGGGPDQPSTCLPGEFGETAIVLHLTHEDASNQMYVYYSTCRGNGFDDGTAKRTLSTEACQPLIQQPVAIYSGSHASVSKCMPH